MTTPKRLGRKKKRDRLSYKIFHRVRYWLWVRVYIPLFLYFSEQTSYFYVRNRVQDHDIEIKKLREDLDMLSSAYDRLADAHDLPSFHEIKERRARPWGT